MLFSKFSDNNKKSNQVNHIETDEIILGRLEADVFQSPDEFLVFIPMAGVDLDSLDIAIEGNGEIISVNGQTKITPPDEIFSTLTKECVWGDYHRHIILPQSVVVDNVQVNFDNGVLVLNLPIRK